jgi:hypothetical protein
LANPEMDMDPGFLWVAVVVGGPILLGVALLYGVVHRRRRRNTRPDGRGGEGTAISR